MKGTYAVAAMVRNLQQAHTAFARAGEVEGTQRGTQSSMQRAQGTQDTQRAGVALTGT